MSLAGNVIPYGNGNRMENTIAQMEIDLCITRSIACDLIVTTKDTKDVVDSIAQQIQDQYPDISEKLRILKESIESIESKYENKSDLKEVKQSLNELIYNINILLIKLRDVSPDFCKKFEVLKQILETIQGKVKKPREKSTLKRTWIWIKRNPIPTVVISVVFGALAHIISTQDKIITHRQNQTDTLIRDLSNKISAESNKSKGTGSGTGGGLLQSIVTGVVGGVLGSYTGRF